MILILTVIGVLLFGLAAFLNKLEVVTEAIPHPRKPADIIEPSWQGFILAKKIKLHRYLYIFGVCLSLSPFLFFYANIGYNYIVVYPNGYRTVIINEPGLKINLFSDRVKLKTSSIVDTLGVKMVYTLPQDDDQFVQMASSFRGDDDVNRIMRSVIYDAVNHGKIDQIQYSGVINKYGIQVDQIFDNRQPDEAIPTYKIPYVRNPRPNFCD